MITKILFTALIVLAALTFLRHKNGSDSRRENTRREQQAGERRRAMLVAVTLVALTLTISGAIYYSHWQEAHRLFSVSVINSHSGEVQTYRVYHRDIGERRFRTVDGRLIAISDAERMEVLEGAPGERHD